jgi:opacity protein-like surface antigen
MHKRYLLASAAIAILASAGQAQARDLYISVLGGANWWEDQSQAGGESNTVISFETNTGFVLGGAVGLHLDNWLRGLRTEVEASYRRNNFDGHWVNTETSSGAVDGSVSTFALMANVWYDIDLGSRLKPYLGGGAGWSRSHVDVVILTSSGATRSGEGTDAFDVSGFSWQLGAGVNYEVMPGVDVGLGYRFRVDPRLTFKEGGEFGGEGFGGEDPFREDNHSHTVAVNLTIDIN